MESHDDDINDDDQDDDDYSIKDMTIVHKNGPNGPLCKSGRGTTCRFFCHHNWHLNFFLGNNWVVLDKKKLRSDQISNTSTAIMNIYSACSKS